MKRKTHVKRKPEAAPKIKKVKLKPEVVLHVEVPQGHVPVVIPDVDPHTMVIAPAPAKQPRETWWQYLGLGSPDRTK